MIKYTLYVYKSKASIILYEIIEVLLNKSMLFDNCVFLGKLFFGNSCFYSYSIYSA